MLVTKLLFTLFTLFLTYIHADEQQPPAADHQTQPSDTKLQDFTIAVLPSHQVLIKHVADELHMVQPELQHYACHSLKSNNCAQLARTQAEYNAHKHRYTRNIGAVIENTVQQFGLTKDPPKRRQAPSAVAPAVPAAAAADSGAVQTEVFEFDITDEDNIDQIFAEMKKQLQQALRRAQTDNTGTALADNTDDVTNAQLAAGGDGVQNVEVRFETYTIVMDDEGELTELDQHVLNRLLHKQRNLNRQQGDDEDDDGSDNDSVAEELAANLVQVA